MTSGGLGAPSASIEGETGRSIFISYAHEDIQTAERLASFLERQGLRTWKDTARLRAGEQFTDAIGSALEEAGRIVVLWSRTSASSHWVLDEAAFGRDRGVLFPVSIDDSEPPLGFRHIHTTRLLRPLDDEEFSRVFSDLLEPVQPILRSARQRTGRLHHYVRLLRRHPGISAFLAACAFFGIGIVGWRSTLVDELPSVIQEVRRQVALVGEPGAADAFYMNSSEISNAQYYECTKFHKCSEPAGTEDARDFGTVANAALAITNITAAQARAFCKWIGGDLPTFQQWMAAAMRIRRAETSDVGSLKVEVPAQPSRSLSPLRNVVGNYAEWSRTRCELATCKSLPVGVEPEGALRILGFSWMEIRDDGLPSSDDWLTTPSYPERLQLADVPDPTVSFRCVYPLSR